MKNFLKIHLGIVVVLLGMLAAPAANVRVYFNQNFAPGLDTNDFIATPIGTNILANGNVIPQGAPVRFHQRPDGYSTNYFNTGFYSLKNVKTGGQFVINVYDSGPTLYDLTNVLHSGFNLYMTTVYGAGSPPTKDQVTNALGYVPAAPIDVTNGSSNVVANFGGSHLPEWSTVSTNAFQTTNSAALQQAYAVAVSNLVAGLTVYATSVSNSVPVVLNYAQAVSNLTAGLNSFTIGATASLSNQVATAQTSANAAQTSANTASNSVVTEHGYATAISNLVAALNGFSTNATTSLSNQVTTAQTTATAALTFGNAVSNNVVTEHGYATAISNLVAALNGFTTNATTSLSNQVANVGGGSGASTNAILINNGVGTNTTLITPNLSGLVTSTNLDAKLQAATNQLQQNLNGTNTALLAAVMNGTNNLWVALNQGPFYNTNIITVTGPGAVLTGNYTNDGTGVFVLSQFSYITNAGTLFQINGSAYGSFPWTNGTLLGNYKSSSAALAGTNTYVNFQFLSLQPATANGTNWSTVPTNNFSTQFQLANASNVLQSQILTAGISADTATNIAAAKAKEVTNGFGNIVTSTLPALTNSVIASANRYSDSLTNPSVMNALLEYDIASRAVFRKDTNVLGSTGAGLTNAWGTFTYIGGAVWTNPLFSAFIITNGSGTPLMETNNPNSVMYSLPGGSIYAPTGTWTQVSGSLPAPTTFYGYDKYISGENIMGPNNLVQAINGSSIGQALQNPALNGGTFTSLTGGSLTSANISATATMTVGGAGTPWFMGSGGDNSLDFTLNTPPYPFINLQSDGHIYGSTAGTYALWAVDSGGVTNTGIARFSNPSSTFAGSVDQLSATGRSNLFSYVYTNDNEVIRYDASLGRYSYSNLVYGSLVYWNTLGQVYASGGFLGLTTASVANNLSLSTPAFYGNYSFLISGSGNAPDALINVLSSNQVIHTLIVSPEGNFDLDPNGGQFYGGAFNDYGLAGGHPAYVNTLDNPTIVTNPANQIGGDATYLTSIPAGNLAGFVKTNNLPIADGTHFGIVEPDGSTIGRNGSGQLTVIGGGGGGGVTNLSFKDSSTVAWTVASGGGLQTNQANVVDNSITSNKISGKINAGQIDGAAVNVTASFPLASSGGANPNITAAGISGGGHLLGSNGPIMFNATVLGAILGTPPMNGNNVTNQHAFKGGSVVLSNLFQILCTQLADGNTNVTFVMNTNFTTPTVSTAIAQAAAQAMQSNFFMVPYTNGNTVFEYDMVNGRAIITNIATGPSSLNYRDSGGTNYAGGLDGPQTNQIKGLALSLLPVVNDYYISPSNSLAYEGTATILGLGTQANPYRGDFDAIVNSLPSYSVIHPMPGTNWTRAYMGQSTNLSLKEGMVLAGYGQGISIIKRDPTVAPVGASVQVIASTSNNIVVRDLTVDCSGTNELSTAALGGVILGGSRETVMNVTVLNYAGSTNNGGFETWAFDLGAYVGPSTYGHILVDCTASNSVGHYDNGFSVVGQANDIHGNVSYITNVMDSLHRVAFNLQHSRNTVWEGCQGYGGLDLFYADTGSVSNVTLRDNMGNNCARGVTLFVGSGNGWSVQNVSIAGNTINVSTNYFSANKGFVTLLCRETNAASSWNNILVDGNHFGFASPFAGTQIDGNQGSFVVKGFTSNVVGLIRNLTITHNQVDDNLPISIVNVSGLNIKDNYDQFGKPYYNLPDMRDMLAQERALNPLGKGLVLYLPFNEGVGTNVYDWSAVYRNPNAAATPSHLQIIGGYPYSWSTNGPMTNGIVGSPFITNNGSASTEFVVNTTSGFSLTNASLDPSASATFTNCLASSLSFSGSNLTTYIWYKQPAAAAGYSAVPFFFFKNGGGPAFSYAIAGNGTYLWYVTTLMTSNFMQQTASNFCDGNWHNFASTWDGLTWTTYIDNTLIKTNVCRGVFSTLVSPSGNTQPLYLGMSSGGNPTNAVGVITNVMLGAMGKTMIATSTWTYPQLSNQYILDTQYPNFP